MASSIRTLMPKSSFEAEAAIAEQINSAESIMLAAIFMGMYCEFSNWIQTFLVWVVLLVV